MTRSPGRRSLVRRALGLLRRKTLAALGRTPLGSITHVDTEAPVAALTFDGGPDPEWTPRVLDVLAEHDAKATFFVIGKYVDKHPDVVARTVAEGHALGNHTWDHPSFPLVSSRERRDQMLRCREALEPFSTDARLFRPPYCEQSLGSRLDALISGFDVVMASVTAKDWEDRDAAFMEAKLHEGLAPGCVILLHDAVCDQRYRSREPMLAALDAFLTRWSGTYAFVTLPTLIAHGRPRREIWLREPDVERFATYDRVI